MGVLLSIVLWTVLVLFGVVVAALVIPTEVAAEGIVSPDLLDGSADVWWAWGLVRVHADPADGVVLRLAGLRVWTVRGAPEPKEPRPPKKRDDKERSKRTRPSARMVIRIARRALASLRLRLRVVGRIGVGDPYETAKLFGTLLAADRLLPGLDARGVEIDWLEPVVDLDGQLRGRIWPVAIAWIAAAEWWRAR